MIKPERKDQGSILVMAVVFSFITIMLGVTFMSIAVNSNARVTWNIQWKKATWSAYAGVHNGRVDHILGREQFGWRRYYTDRDNRKNENWIKYVKTGLDQDDIDYGLESNVYITGYGKSIYNGVEIINKVKMRFAYETYADYLYLSHRERDTSRHDIIRFWTPDTLDGKVHSNDTISIQSATDSPRFMKRVTTTMNYIDPSNNRARFDMGWGWRRQIRFPDQADELREKASLKFGASGDTLIHIVLDGETILQRKCWPDTAYADSLRCYPDVIAGSNRYTISNNVPSGVVWVQGKLWISASKGRGDIMDGMIPERRFDHPGAFISRGFSGKLTILASDTLIITDNLVYEHSRPITYAVPPTMGECSDVLGLVSEKFIMIHRQVRDTVYINAAMAAVAGSISVQDIYRYIDPGRRNPKVSLQIYGSLAQRNRGIVHTTYPCGYNCERGFKEKDYHYDVRLKNYPPPFYLPTLDQKIIYIEEYQDPG